MERTMHISHAMIPVNPHHNSSHNPAFGAVSLPASKHQVKPGQAMQKHLLCLLTARMPTWWPLTLRTNPLIELFAEGKPPHATLVRSVL